MVNPTKNEQMFVDVGIYGEPNVENYQAKITTRKLEKFVAQAGGFQALYADTYQTREELRQMFDHTLLDNFARRIMRLRLFQSLMIKYLELHELK
jgi:delta24-sterol reductase